MRVSVLACVVCFCLFILYSLACLWPVCEVCVPVVDTDKAHTTGIHTPRTDRPQRMNDVSIVLWSVCAQPLTYYHPITHTHTLTEGTTDFDSGASPIRGPASSIPPLPPFVTSSFPPPPFATAPSLYPFDAPFDAPYLPPAYMRETQLNPREISANPFERRIGGRIEAAAHAMMMGQESMPLPSSTWQPPFMAVTPPRPVTLVSHMPFIPCFPVAMQDPPLGDEPQAFEVRVVNVLLRVCVRVCECDE